MSAREPEPDAEFVREFTALCDDRESVVLEISKYQAWCLLASVQLAARHPGGCETAPVQEAVYIVRGLQKGIAFTPRLAAIAKAGWES
jgi:hypothetical protein